MHAQGRSQRWGEGESNDMETMDGKGHGKPFRALFMYERKETKATPPLCLKETCQTEVPQEDLDVSDRQRSRCKAGWGLPQWET